MRKYQWITILIIFIFLLTSLPITSSATKIDKLTSQEMDEERMALYLKTETTTQIPWYYFAAIDSYERGLRQARNDLPQEEGLIAIHFSAKDWAGSLNPDKDDSNPSTIEFFDGKGRDGNNDGVANRTDDEDILASIATYLATYGFEEKDVRIGLWDYYQRDRTVELIFGHAKVFRHVGSLDLRNRSFPMPLHFNYTYHSTWGDKRGWGGRRMHEGTDIFADYGTPVKATNYGIVEILGWNKYGGWRVGIRDTNNVYHYFAHLSRFEKGIERGTVVEPGDVIAYVGSSGYGKKGTQGKFPPHLHYGMYRDNGYIEWSFDPYNSLKVWERNDKKKKKAQR